MVKGFRQLALLTVLSRILGMLRDMAFAYFIGAKELMDIWVIAFKIPNLSRRIFGEGAASTSFIPVFTKALQEDEEKAKALARTVVTVIFVFLMAIVLIGEVGLFVYIRYFCQLEETRRMLTLAAVMLPYMAMICTVAIFAGILNTYRHFAAPAFAPVMLNIFIITGLAVSAWILELSKTQILFFVAGTVLIAGLSQLALQYIVLKRLGTTIYPAWQVNTPDFRKIIILMAPMILGLTVTQLNTLADDLIAFIFSGSEAKGDFFTLLGHQIRYPVWAGAVSSLFYSQRLYQFPLGVLGISLATAIYPVMSQAAADGDQKSLIETINKGIKGCFFVAAPATIGLILVARPLVAAIFQRGDSGAFTAQDTDRVAYVLLFYAFGLTGFFGQQILTRAFYALKKSKIPAKTGLIAVGTNIILNLILIWFLGVAGLALSTALCSYLQIGILLVILRRQFGSSLVDGLGLIFFKSTVGVIVMTFVGIAVTLITSPLPRTTFCDFVRIMLLVISCAGTYTAAAKVMKNPMLSLVTGKFHKKN